jgi:cytoskeletal protein RodZ
MEQNNTQKLFGALAVVLLILTFFLWRQNNALKTQLETALTNQKTTPVVKKEVKSTAPKPAYKPSTRKASAETQRQQPASSNQEINELQKMLGDLIQLQKGLE